MYPPLKLQPLLYPKSINQNLEKRLLNITKKHVEEKKHFIDWILVYVPGIKILKFICNNMKEKQAFNE